MTITLPKQVPWFDQLLDANATLKECPVPTGCKYGRLDWMEGEIIGAKTNDTALPVCSVRSNACKFGESFRRRKAAALAEKISQVDYSAKLVQPEKTKALEATRKVLADRGRFLVLSGLPGRGKDFAFASWFMDSGLQLSKLHWIKAPWLISEANEQSQQYKQWSKAKNSVFVLQDLGTEKEKLYGDSTVNLVLEFFDCTYGNGNTVLMSTNLDKAHIVKRYGDRFQSRLDGYGQFYSISSKEKDMRL